MSQKLQSLFLNRHHHFKADQGLPKKVAIKSHHLLHIRLKRIKSFVLIHAYKRRLKKGSNCLLYLGKNTLRFLTNVQRIHLLDLLFKKKNCLYTSSRWSRLWVLILVTFFNGTKSSSKASNLTLYHFACSLFIFPFESSKFNTLEPFIICPKHLKYVRLALWSLLGIFLV